MLSAFLAVSDRTRPSFFFCCDVSLMSRSLLRCSAQVFRSNNFFSTFAKDFLMTLSVSHWQLLRTFYNLSLLLLRPLKSSSSEKKKSFISWGSNVCVYNAGMAWYFLRPPGLRTIPNDTQLEKVKKKKKNKSLYLRHLIVNLIYAPCARLANLRWHENCVGGRRCRRVASPFILLERCFNELIT